MKDQKIFELAAKKRHLQEQMKELKKEEAKVVKKITSELEQRGVKAIEGEGLRVTYVAHERTTYDVAKAKKVLGPKVFKEVTTEKIDTDSLQALLEQGSISVSQLKKFASIAEGKPYVRVSELKDDEVLA